MADHRKELKLLADGLLEFETLDSDEVTLVIQTKSLNALRKKRRQEKEALNKLKKDVLQFVKDPIKPKDVSVGS